MKSYTVLVEKDESLGVELKSDGFLLLESTNQKVERFS